MEDTTGIDQTNGDTWDDSNAFNFSDHYYAPPAAKNYEFTKNNERCMFISRIKNV